MQWHDNSCFRVDIRPKSPLGKLLALTATRLRDASKASPNSIVTKTTGFIDIDDTFGSFKGKFTVQPKSNSISFIGGNCGYHVEYVYGHLTITKTRNRYVPEREAKRIFTLFLKRFNRPYEFIEATFTKVGVK